MFANQRRGTTGLESIIAVALVLLGYVGSTGLLLKTYRAGAPVVTSSGCEVVCRQGVRSAKT
jgi:hypothetical protein